MHSFSNCPCRLRLARFLFSDVEKVMQREMKKRLIQSTLTTSWSTRLCSSLNSDYNSRPHQPMPEVELRENENEHSASLLLTVPESETAAPTRADELRSESIARRNKRRGVPKAPRSKSSFCSQRQGKQWDYLEYLPETNQDYPRIIVEYLEAQPDEDVWADDSGKLLATNQTVQEFWNNNRGLKQFALKSYNKWLWAHGKKLVKTESTLNTTWFTSCNRNWKGLKRMSYIKVLPMVHTRLQALITSRNRMKRKWKSQSCQAPVI